MARSTLTIRKLFGIVAVVAVVLYFCNALLDAVSIPRSAITPTAIGETHSRIHIFAATHGRLPAGLDELKERNGYVNRTDDLWGRKLIYEIDAQGIITLGSYGRDGTIGGSGEDADILHRYRSLDESGQFIADDNLWVIHGEILPGKGGG